MRAEATDFGSLWVSDTELVSRLMEEVEATGVRQVAFWYLGLEDASFWRRLRR